MAAKSSTSGNCERCRTSILLEITTSQPEGQSKVLAAGVAAIISGKTVPVTPHITDAVQDWIVDVAQRSADGSEETPDVCIIELGGTVGDIESAPILGSPSPIPIPCWRENVTCCPRFACTCDGARLVNRKQSQHNILSRN